jgi:hypothetical protein
MKVPERQLLILHQTTVESLKVNDRLGLYTYDDATRRRIAEEVFNQQDGQVEVRPTLIDPRERGAV